METENSPQREKTIKHLVTKSNRDLKFWAIGIKRGRMTECDVSRGVDAGRKRRTDQNVEKLILKYNDPHMGHRRNQPKSSKKAPIIRRYTTRHKE